MRELLEFFCDFVSCCPFGCIYSNSDLCVYTWFRRIIATTTCVTARLETTIQGTVKYLVRSSSGFVESAFDLHTISTTRPVG